MEVHHEIHLASQLLGVYVAVGGHLLLLHLLLLRRRVELRTDHARRLHKHAHRVSVLAEELDRLSQSVLVLTEVAVVQCVPQAHRQHDGIRLQPVVEQRKPCSNVCHLRRPVEADLRFLATGGQPCEVAVALEVVAAIITEEHAPHRMVDVARLGVTHNGDLHPFPDALRSLPFVQHAEAAAGGVALVGFPLPRDRLACAGLRLERLPPLHYAAVLAHAGRAEALERVDVRSVAPGPVLHRSHAGRRLRRGAIHGGVVGVRDEHSHQSRAGEARRRAHEFGGDARAGAALRVSGQEPRGYRSPRRDRWRARQ
mmetsp:Transcript_42104/g.131838  ORF Transcript_42104/g.131838 Transcript_42104/m.131838 type:complete len:312 (+) Transcript_42104:1313-2248(+)